MAKSVDAELTEFYSKANSTSDHYYIILKLTYNGSESYHARATAFVEGERFGEETPQITPGDNRVAIKGKISDEGTLQRKDVTVRVNYFDTTWGMTGSEYDDYFSVDYFEKELRFSRTDTRDGDPSSDGNLCGTSDIEIFFEESQIRIRPIEIDSYENSSKYNYAKIRVTQEAAQYVYAEHKTREPVSIVSNGTTVARYMIPDKDDTITTTDDTGYIRLEDPLKILSYTNINKKFHGKQTLEDVVGWIFNRAVQEDKHGVLSDWTTSDEEFKDITEWSTVGGIRVPLLSDIYDTILQTLFEGKPLKKAAVNMDFEDEDALSCLNRVAENYGVPVWSMGSTLMLGSRQYDTTVYPAGLTRDYVALTGISAPSVRNPIKAVRVRGAAKNSSEQSKWELNKNDKAVRAEGAAVRTDLDDGEGVEVFFDARTTYDGEDLEDIARRKIQSTIGNETGSCTVDVLSTAKSGIDIKQVKLGDAIYVPEYKECRRPIEEGFYEVTGIHHKLSNWVGWNAILDLRDMNSGTINTESYFFDPTSEEFITDEDYDMGATLNFLLDESL